MKKILCLFLVMLMHQLTQATVKVFVNDSQKQFAIDIYNMKKGTISITLSPGAIQEVFLPYETISKITIQDKKHNLPLSNMAQHILRKDIHPINENMKFIIHKDASVSMYKGSTDKDKALLEMDAFFVKNSYLPSIETVIHTTKKDVKWPTQTISYNVKTNKSFLQSIESLFQSHP